MYRKRIVITGIGLISPIGDTQEEYFENLIAGKSAIRNTHTIDTSRVRCQIAGDIGDYDTKKRIKQFEGKIPVDTLKKMKKISKTAPFATKTSMIAAMDAFIDAGLFDFEFDHDRMAAILGGHNFHDRYIVKNILQFEEEPEYIDGLMGIVVYDSDIIASISDVLQIYGPMYTTGGTCTSSGIALKNAINEINYNDCDMALVGGGMLDYSKVGFQALSLVNAISFKSFNDKPEEASRPFDMRREGFVPSHGTAFVIIEDYEHAKKRKAKIYAEILAVNSNNDGNHLSNPSVIGQTKLMRKVIKQAGLKIEDIDYINCHATSTMLGDRTEIKSIKEVFGEHAYKLKVNAPKSILGHTGWTCHIMELIAGILQMNNSKLHPSVNIETIDPEIDIDVCANKPQDYEINYFLKNSFGFGGINCCTVVKKIKE